MKLLSWMHRKQQKDTAGSFKGSAIGSSCLSLKSSPNYQEDYVRHDSNSKLRQQPQNQCQRVLKECKAQKTEDITNEELSDIFPGFLTIGTLSVEPVTEPTTPTFQPHEETNENELAELKYDLKLINEELEKFIWAEAKKEGNKGSSGRSSQASTVTLTDEDKGKVDEHKDVNLQAHPLQEYLLGSYMELLETKQKTKKQKRSLQELSLNSKIEHTNSSIKPKGKQKQGKKEFKSPSHLMNKLLPTPQPSHMKTTASNGCTAESLPTVKKLNKIKQLFHKKIHPETSTAPKETNKFAKHASRKIPGNSGNSHLNSALSCGSNIIGCWGTLMKREHHHSKSDAKISEDAITKKKSNISSTVKSGGASREHWINTDADYFVLELQKNDDVQ